MFMSLDDNDMQVVIDAMDQKVAKANEYIINEGEPGEVLYIVESGSLSCTKVLGGKETFLK
jgi:cAMP-dependent protein kinase regulator